VLLNAFVVGLSLLTPPAGPSWSALKAIIRQRFPEVRQISAESLAQRLAAEEEIILIDVRPLEEYEVSHLPGALRVEPGSKLPEALVETPRDRVIVAYCSVGYRSSEFVRSLMKKGFTHAANLEGSIFEWANEGHVVVRDGMPVREVHPYDRLWGRLLREELRASAPGETQR
jgi:rhodanese-related sulfurtransferase